MAEETTLLGIDIGSISIASVLLDAEGSVIQQQYLSHNGTVGPALADVFKTMPVTQVSAFGVVAEKGREFFTTGIEVNEQVAIIEGVKHLCPTVRAILTIGGENFGLILLDDQGRYKKFISNSACAAGTGSFLDQQALRLGLSGSEELSRIAALHEGQVPKIATRCAVFAKTDLIHIQQQGYGLNAIAAGLSCGVAQNICDTLMHGVDLQQPMVAVGGVSRNRTVIQCIEKSAHVSIEVLDHCETTGALGAALMAEKHLASGTAHPMQLNALINTEPVKRSYFYAPLGETHTDTPGAHTWRSYVSDGVEIDLYEPLHGGTVTPCYLGIDIGSTSTKALLMNREKTPMVGMYTRTKGQPIAAIQQLTSTLEAVEKDHKTRFSILSTGTTGSGRKFIQRVARADYTVDEITAHARAAWHLNPSIDTIIEIGGQDAKFTVMKNGHVVFSVMNYVCAAGTGSFIEEQAKRLQVPLDRYAELAMAQRAPLISNRCTVFMERDLNRLLSQGYTKQELLASVLHSVRDNYLTKVAHVNKIGRHIAFQGATAKNHALVKAFEQTLGQGIYVSRYCHLTGALGVCLKLAEAVNMTTSRFRRDLHRETIEVDEYICEFCHNNCKIKQIEIEGEQLGWGYLCGRDEANKGFQKKAHTEFDLLHTHRRIFDVDGAAEVSPQSNSVNLFHEFKQGGIKAVIRRPELSLSHLRNRIQFNLLELHSEMFRTGIVSKDDGGPLRARIGLPRTLTLLEYLPLWELFFKLLGFEPVLSGTDSDLIQAGREIRGAEYCTPITEFHGHMKCLLDTADWVFFPQMFETGDEEARKYYCYYSHFAVPVVQNILGEHTRDKFVAPLLNMNDSPDEIIRALYLALPEALKKQTSFNRVDESYRLAHDWFWERKRDLQTLYTDQLGQANDISVALLGRPYMILNPRLNQGIPEKLSEKGIQSFFMDMIPEDEALLDVARDFAGINHWHYGNQIIKKAEIVARTEGLFPIFITAFKCSPDSFIVSYFKQIMDYYGKPYLILQLDDHSASEGYDTRIEAAIETFRGHQGSGLQTPRPSIHLKRQFEDRVYLLAAYDPVQSRLVQAAFQHAGIDTRLVPMTPDLIARGLQYNDGQCLPISSISLGIQRVIDTENLDPAKVVYFSNSEMNIACNLPQYPVMIKQVLEKLGHGLDQVEVMVSRFLPTDLPIELMYNCYMAYVFTGLIQKMTHRIRPRQRQAGQTDRVLEQSMTRLVQCFAEGLAKEAVFQDIVADFQAIDIQDRSLPQVGIVGDLFVRDNDAYNQHLVEVIEAAGAEVVTVPFIDSIGLYADVLFRAQWIDGRYLDLLTNKVTFNTLRLFGNRLRDIAKPILGSGECHLKHAPETYLKTYFLEFKHGGETVENLLKVFYLKETYANLKFIINANPIFCCPGLISEAIYKTVENDIDIPILSILYDGSEADKNRVLKPYLHYLQDES